MEHVSCMSLPSNIMYSRERQVHFTPFEFWHQQISTYEKRRIMREKKDRGDSQTTSRLKSKCFVEETLASCCWREWSLVWSREQPIMVWPRLASSNAKALPNPLLTPVINTFLEAVASFTPEDSHKMVVIGKAFGFGVSYKQ